MTKILVNIPLCLHSWIRHIVNIQIGILFNVIMFSTSLIVFYYHFSTLAFSAMSFIYTLLLIMTYHGGGPAFNL